MNYWCLDAEWNGDTADVIHTVVVKKYPDGGKETFTDINDFHEWTKRVKPDKYFIHSGLTADVPVINKALGGTIINPEDVVDTFVVSRLVNYEKFQTHSLKELGVFLGVHKGDYTGGWDVCTPEMIEYCEQDVDVLEAIVKHYWKYIIDPKWADAMRLEHEISTICHDMQTNGFLFEKEKAEELLEDVKNEMKDLEDSFSTSFPAKLVEVKRLKLRYTKDKKLFKNILDALVEYPKVEFEGEEVVVYDYKEFNPASPKERIDALWEAGWKPIEKTKGHIKSERDNRYGART